MSLWIRSQNRRNFVKATDVDVSIDDDKVLLVNCYEFGRYETAERVLEIIDDIQEFVESDCNDFINKDGCKEYYSLRKNVYQLPIE